MKILFYIEPWIEKGKPFWKNSWIPIFIKIAKNLNKSKDVSLYFIIGDAQKQFALELEKYGNVGIIDQSELMNIHQNYNIALDEWYKGTYEQESLQKMQKLALSKLSGFEPDIIWSFVSPVPFLKDAFINSLVFYQELGLLGRNPYPSTWYLDPLGTFGNSFVSKFNQELKENKLSEKQLINLELIREKYFKIIRATNPFKRIDIDVEEKFDKLILLPLQYSGYFVFDSVCNYASQYEFLIDILENTPHNIGIVVTEHINPIAEVVLDNNVITYLEGRYPNFIYKEVFNEYHLSSQYLLDIVDGVVSVSSTVGLQALFWKKALLSFYKSNLSSLAHITEIGNIQDIHNFKYDENSRDNVLYFLFMKYYIPDEYLSNGSWLYSFLNTSLEKYRKKEMSFYFYENIDTEEKMLQFFLTNDRPFARKKPGHNKVKESDSSLDEASLRAILNKVQHRVKTLESELELVHNSKVLKYTKYIRKIYYKIKAYKN